MSVALRTLLRVRTRGAAATAVAVAAVAGAAGAAAGAAPRAAAATAAAAATFTTTTTTAAAAAAAATAVMLPAAGAVRVTWGDDGRPQSARFHWNWLAHHCASARHPTTGEHMRDASEVPATLTAAAVTVDGVDAARPGSGRLVVTWAGGGVPPSAPGRVGLPPVSSFELAWLRRHAYDDAAAADVDAPPPPSHLPAVTLSAAAYRDWPALAAAAAARVRRDGVVFVTDVLAAAGGGGGGGGGAAAVDAAAAATTEAIVAAFERGVGLALVPTHFGRIEDLRTDNATNANTDQLGYTSAPVEPHTDQPFIATPPRYQLLQGIRPATTGGESYIVDGGAAARYLAATDAEAYHLLTTVPVTFHRKQRAFESVQVRPLLAGGDGQDFTIRYSYFTYAPFRVPFRHMAAWYRAYNAFAAIVRNPAHQYRATLAPGDFVLYDNWRMLHARTAFTGPRWVRGIYFDPAAA